MKGGIGSAAIRLPNGLTVGAIVAVNAVGDVIDPASGQVVAGVRTQDGQGLADARKLLRDGSLIRSAAPRPTGNTTIAVVATNARLTKIEVSRVALMADDGLPRAISPSHTMADGDTVFALATGRWNGQADASIVGALAADVLAEAIVRAVSQAETLAWRPVPLVSSVPFLRASVEPSADASDSSTRWALSRSACGRLDSSATAEIFSSPAAGSGPG
jgi:L-aminopeptidase/D-esterase-like protein